MQWTDCGCQRALADCGEHEHMQHTTLVWSVEGICFLSLLHFSQEGSGCNVNLQGGEGGCHSALQTQ